MPLFRRSMGSVADAAWLRRQFTRDSELVHDLRHGFRVMRHRPGFFALAVGILALGIGSTTAVFSITRAIVFRDLPYPEPDRLVAIWQRDSKTPAAERGEVAPANFLDWRAAASSFEAMATMDPYSLDLTGMGEPRVLFGARVSERFFDVLRAQPLHGRLFGLDDHVAGKRIVVLGAGAWTREFGSDPNIIGRAIQLDGHPYTVIGVLPPEFELALFGGEQDRDVWIPKVFEEYEKTSRTSGWWAAIGRLGSGATMQGAQAELDLISARLAKEHPRTNATTSAYIEPLSEHLIGAARAPLALLIGSVLAVLLIACANVANMLLVRGADRQREFAVRGALGAGRGRLTRQLLAEAALIALAGTALGIAVAAGVVNVVRALAPRDVPRLAGVQLDWGVVAIAAVIGVGTALIAGLAPAIRFSRLRAPDGVGSSRGATQSKHAGRLRDGLAIAEVALAVALLVGAGLLLRSFGQLLAVDRGFSGDRVLALQVFAWDRQETPEKRAAFFRDTLADLRTIPGIVDVGAVSAMPLIDANINIQGPIAIEGRPPAPTDAQPTTFMTVATPGYFSAMDIPVLQGRPLPDQDVATSAPVAVITSALARKHWPDESAVGSFARVRFAGPVRRVQIVGVVGDLRHDALDRPAREEMFLPHAQAPYGSMTYVLRAAGDPAGLVEAARRRIWKHDPLLAFYDTATVRELVAASVAPRRFSLVLVSAFALIALVLAAAGMFGVLSVATTQQTREFGVRIALGASSREVCRLVIGRGLRMAGAGLVIGLAMSAAAGKWMRAVLFEVSPIDPLTLAAVAAITIAVAVLACYLPARRAMKLDPQVALRE